MAAKGKGGAVEVPTSAVRKNRQYPGEGFYTGQIVNHKRHGVGVMKEANGTVLYEGEWKDDKHSGYGKKYFPRTGDRHEGSYKNGERHGLGVYLWANGNRYSGDWSLGLMHGRGRFEWVGSGEVYNGEWVQGKMMGEGIKVLGDTSRMSGTFRDGELHGWAEKTFAGGDRYRGYFKNNRRCGYGEYVWADGRSYRGTWADELMHGSGELVAAAHSSSHASLHSSGIDSVVQYRGEVHRGSLQGHGTARMFDGSLYTGDWLDDHWEGWGRVEYQDGSVYEGDVRQGHRAGLGQLTCHFQEPSQVATSLTDGISTPIFAALTSVQPLPPAPQAAFEPPEEELDFAAQGPQVSVEAILNTWGGIYIGAWRADVPHGQGTLQLWNGQMFQGTFVNGKISESDEGVGGMPET